MKPRFIILVNVGYLASPSTKPLFAFPVVHESP